MLVEAGLAIAISYVLHFIVLFHMPQGGSIHAAHLVPLLIYAYRWGLKAGVTACIVYGILVFLLGFKYSIHPLSIVLDYVVAYGLIGIAGGFKDTKNGLLIGSLLACFGRWCSSVISGAVVFGSYAPAGQNPWIYSLIYNTGYILPDAIINVVVLLLVYPSINKGLKANK